MNLPLAGVIRVTPSSPKRLYLPLRANLHRQVWGLDSVPCSFNGEATSAFWSGGGAGGTPCKGYRAAASSGGGSARTMAKRQRGLMVHQLPCRRRSRRTGQNDGCFKGTRGGDFPQGNTTRYLTDGKPERQEKQGLSITGVWGSSP